MTTVKEVPEEDDRLAFVCFLALRFMVALPTSAPAPGNGGPVILGTYLLSFPQGIYSHTHLVGMYRVPLRHWGSFTACGVPPPCQQ